MSKRLHHNYRRRSNYNVHDKKRWLCRDTRRPVSDSKHTWPRGIEQTIWATDEKHARAVFSSKHRVPVSAITVERHYTPVEQARARKKREQEENKKALLIAAGIVFLSLALAIAT